MNYLQAIQNVYKHPRTTLVAAFLAALNVFVNGVHWKQVAIAAAVAALGAAAKDPGGN
jgi:hypothetical protein